MLTDVQTLPWRSYTPLGGLKDRNARELLLPEQIDYLVERADEAVRTYHWEAPRATAYMEFMRSGDRSRFQNIYYPRRFNLMLMAVAEWAENKGRYVEAIADALWSICEESGWVIPAHNNNHLQAGESADALPNFEKAPYVDLFAAETASVISWTVYLTKRKLDALSPVLCRRALHEVKERVLRPCQAAEDYHWMGLGQKKKVNNWNPWINSNLLAALLLTEENSEVRAEGVHKILRSLSAFVNGYAPDGGCEEGAHYWEEGVASFFDALEMLYEWSGGAVSFYGEEKIRNMARYITRMHVCENRYVNFGDGGMRLNMPGELLYRIGVRAQDSLLQNWGAYIFHTCNQRQKRPTYHVYRYLNHLLHYRSMLQQPYIDDREPFCALDSVQVMAARTDRASDRGLMLCCKGGHNGESHNHNDTGNFVLYCDGQPVVIDVGVEEYSAKTFSDRRYTIWTMQSAYHNLPIIEGLQQKDGPQYHAAQVQMTDGNGIKALSMRLDTAYEHGGLLQSYRRTVSLDTNGNGTARVRETMAFTHPVQKLAFHMMLCCAPEICCGHVVLYSEYGAAITVDYDESLFEVSCEAIRSDDRLMMDNWGGRVWRLRFSLRCSVQELDTVFSFEQKPFVSGKEDKNEIQ